MANDETPASIETWLKERGYTAEETQKILTKLAQHDHETISDAIYDSLGAGDKSLDQMIADMLRD
ncbi:MAG: hypothetical protein JF612_01040 [Planctomycetia bacterium]|jgi:hypothetical protein|nr:hypothetical protein [Planctomycetia bacterium]